MVKENKICVTNIQRMCFHDGPGIRTTVFLKGCSLHCPWCSNPENISTKIQNYEKDGNKGTYGKYYSAEEIFKEVLKDKAFWGNDGGVTFSGGEALMQADALQKLLLMLKELSIHTAVETALFAPKVNIEKIYKLIDYFIVDLKILDPVECKNILGGNVDVFIDNFNRLYEMGKLSLIRIPCSEEYTLTDNNIDLITKFLVNHKHIPVQIFKIHGLGEKKYKSLGLESPRLQDVKDEKMIYLKKELTKNNIMCEIIKI